MRAYAIALMIAAGLALASIVPSDLAQAQSPANGFESKAIGKVFTANGSVTIEHTSAVVVQAAAGGNGQAKVGDFVYQGDVVQTGAESAVGIVFLDGAAFNLASNARITLNEFVYSPNRSTNTTFFSLSKGTLTFVAGKIAKTGNMKIDTPVAIMGIRGTTPRIEIGEDGKVTFSTLVEENKPASTPERRGRVVPPSKQRETKGEPTPGTSAAAMAEKKPSFQICRGC
jgi:hypothetical protein